MSRTNKRAIPPLPPSKTAIEISQAGEQFSDLRAKMTLIEKAHGSSSRTDLNDVIEQLKHIFDRDCQASDSLHASIYSKQQELARLRDDFDRLYSEFDEFRSRSSIVNVIATSSDIEAKLAHLRASAEEAEESRLRFQGAPYRRRPAMVLSAKADDCWKFFHMTELNFELLESLIHLMKKNLFAMDSCDGDVRTARGLFGSVTGAVDAYHRFRRENMELRDAERRYMQDAFIKRRPLQRVSIEGVRLIVQSLIQRLRDCAEFSDTDPTIGFDVDRVFPGPPDDQDDSPASLDRQMAQLEKTHRENLQKLAEQDEIPIVQSDTRANVRLVQQLNESFSMMRPLTLSIFDRAAEASAVWRRVYSVQTDWHRFKALHAAQLIKMKDLAVDHLQLLHHVEQNAAVVESIFQTAAQLGRSLMAQSHRDLLFQWLKGVSLPDEEDRNFLTRPTSALPSIPLYRKHVRNPHRYMRGLNILVNGVHFEFVKALAVLFRIGKAVGLADRDLEYLTGVWPTIRILLGLVRPMLEGCKNELKQDILQLQEAEKVVLRWPKIPREITCDIVTWGECEVQTEEKKTKSK
jgi:hypothetical protein